MRLLSRKDNNASLSTKQKLLKSSIDRNVEKILKAIMKNFDNKEASNELSEALHSIANGESNEENSRVLLGVLRILCERDDNVGAADAAKDLLTFLLESAKWGPYADSDEKSYAQGSDSDKKADQTVNDAKAQAEKIKEKAQAEAERILDAKREDFVPRAVKDLIEGYRKEDAAEYGKSEEARKELLRELKKTHASLCDQIKDLQAEMNKALNSAQDKLTSGLTEWSESFYKNKVDELKEDAEEHSESEEARKDLLRELEKAHASLCDRVQEMNEALNSARDKLINGLTEWRESFYKNKVDELANCYVNLERILNRQINEAAAAQTEEGAAQQLVEQLGGIRKNLNRFAKQLRNAMLGVGLDVYIPVEGDRFDPAQHTLGESDEDNYKLEGWEIARCVLPGVRMLESGEFESLIRAEVELK